MTNTVNSDIKTLLQQIKDRQRGPEMRPVPLALIIRFILAHAGKHDCPVHVEVRTKDALCVTLKTGGSAIVLTLKIRSVKKGEKACFLEEASTGYAYSPALTEILKRACLELAKNVQMPLQVSLTNAQLVQAGTENRKKLEQLAALLNAALSDSTKNAYRDRASAGRIDGLTRQIRECGQAAKALSMIPCGGI